jgi:hypothetical protein
VISGGDSPRIASIASTTVSPRFSLPFGT